MTGREQFEAEYRKRSDRDDDDVEESLRLGKDGEYIYDGTWTAFYWWQAARAQSPQVPEGMALVPVSKLRDAERYAWLKENCGERLTRRSLLNEFSEHKTEYIFPSLIAWADFCGQITLDEAIDFKIEAAKESR